MRRHNFYFWNALLPFSLFTTLSFLSFGPTDGDQRCAAAAAGVGLLAAWSVHSGMHPATASQRLRQVTEGRNYHRLGGAAMTDKTQITLAMVLTAAGGLHTDCALTPASFCIPSTPRQSVH